jgi:hypothetical protein
MSSDDMGYKESLADVGEERNVRTRSHSGGFDLDTALSQETRSRARRVLDSDEDDQVRARRPKSCVCTSEMPYFNLGGLD